MYKVDPKKCLTPWFYNLKLLYKNIFWSQDVTCNYTGKLNWTNNECFEALFHPKMAQLLAGSNSNGFDLISSRCCDSVKSILLRLPKNCFEGLKSPSTDLYVLPSSKISSLYWPDTYACHAYEACEPRSLIPATKYLFAKTESHSFMI